MSQSASWQGQNFSNPQTGNVQFFDPTKFQASTAPTTVANNVDQVANGQAPPAGASNSWNSWQWGNNADQGYSTDGANAQGQVQGQAELTKQGTADAVQSQPQVQQGDGNQYYYNHDNQWNQGAWDPNNPQQNYQNYEGQQVHSQQAHSQQAHGQQAEQQVQGQAYWGGYQWQQPGQQPGQQWTNNFQQGVSQDQAAPVTSQAQSVDPNTAGGQYYDQVSPDTSGNFSHSSASYFSNSAGLNDSTSSSLDQSSSSQHLDPTSTSSDSSALIPEDSEAGTVSGFFGRDDDYSQEPAVTKVPPQFLNVNPGIQRTDSAISNASLQTMNYSSQGSLGSIEDVNKGVQDVSNQMQNVAFGENPSDNVFHHQENQNQNSEVAQMPQSEEEDKQSSNLNDWEVISDQGNADVNFFIGANQDQGGNPNQGQSQIPQGVPQGGNANQDQSMNPVSPPSFSQAPPTVSEAPPPMFMAPPTTGAPNMPGHLEAPTQSGSPGADNPFRKASPRNVRRNLSNQSLPSLQGDAPASGSPVIFGGANVPESRGTPTMTSGQGQAQAIVTSPLTQVQGVLSSGASGQNIPMSEPSLETDSAFKPTVPTDTIETMTKSSSLLAQAASLTSFPPDETKQDPPDKKEQDKDVKTNIPDAEKSPDSKPPVPPGSRSAPMSPRKHTSAFQPVHRAKHSMSPATTLWDNMDAPASNIILAPAAAPVVSSSSSTSEGGGVKSPLPVIPMQASLESKLKDKAPEKKKGRDLDRVSGETRGHSRQNSRGSDRVRSRDDEKKKEDDNRSINSLDELDAQMDYRDRDEYRDKRYRERYSYRDREYRDPRYDYDRPPSRSDPYRDYGRRRDPRDTRDPYSREGYAYDERYERPRSRQEDDRPGSRTGQEVDQRSRADYDREMYHRERDRYRQSGYGYGYDYSQSRGYYDQQDAYGYYRDPRDARYSRGYYEEMGYYGKQGHGNRYSDNYGSHYDDYDRYSHHSLSRGHTPAIDDNVNSADYYQQQQQQPNNGSRSSSRQDTDDAQAYARHGYDYDYGYDAYAYDGYAYDPHYGYYYKDSQYQQEAPGRMTPQKHTIPHIRASFGANGTLVKMLPNRPADGQPATVEIHKLEEMMADNTETDELKTFPGPLTRTDTHKNDVLQFCQKMAQQCADNINMVDRESAELIWKLMELIIKQNGSVVGTDIADLLLEGHQPTSLEYSMMGMKISQSTEEIDKVGEDDSSEVKVTSDRSQVNKGKSLEEVTDRFRDLLLYGRKKDALEWATKNNLWGHALFLASKMDTRTHANVMIRFANTAMKMNDPLQTLYQLMSGRQPAAVTCVVDERWGDWRPHLAMILSNTSAKPDLDRKAIAALGDTMASKGCLHASHFCYIMAQTSFGTYTKKTSKIVLIGSSHNSSWEDFSTNNAIQCTEVYEYAQALGSHGFLLPNFQVYKFLYATRLIEYGFLEEALHYCEVIASAVQVSPSWFQPAFVKILYETANRLKFHDPQRVHAADEAEDPAWLQQLQKVCSGYDDGSIQPMSGSATPAIFGGTTASSESGDVASYNGGQTDYQYNQGQTYTQYGQDGGYQQDSQNYTQTQDSQNYTQTQNYGQQQTYGQENYNQQSNYNQQTTEQYNAQYVGTATGEQPADVTQQTAEQQTTQQTEWQNQYNYNNYGYQSQETNQQSADVVDSTPQTDPQTYGNHGYNQQQQYGGDYSQNYSESDRLASQRGSVVSTQSIDTEGSQTDGQTVPSSNFDYFGAATTAKIVAPASRYRTTSGSSTGSVGRQRTMSESSTGSVKASNPVKKSQTDSNINKKQAAKQDGKKGGGWFGGWFGGSGGKKKNKEVHLPKDDKPAIVWDPVGKKWLNTDEDESESAPAMPPPKDTDLGGKMPPGPASDSAAMPPPSGNRFSLQKGRGARNQYVDVLSTKTTPAASVPSNLFNVMPSATPAAPSTQIFNPSGGPVSSEASSQQRPASSAGSSQQLLEPPGGDLSRSSSMSSLSREVQQFTSQPDQGGQAPVTNPIMFNPAQFTAPQTAQPTANKGPKYGQRRQYPK